MPRHALRCDICCLRRCAPLVMPAKRIRSAVHPGLVRIQAARPGPRPLARLINSLAARRAAIAASACPSHIIFASTRGPCRAMLPIAVSIPIRNSRIPLLRFARVGVLPASAVALAGIACHRHIVLDAIRARIRVPVGLPLIPDPRSASYGAPAAAGAAVGAGALGSRVVGSRAIGSGGRRRCGSGHSISVVIAARGSLANVRADARLFLRRAKQLSSHHVSSNHVFTLLGGCCDGIEYLYKHSADAFVA